MDPRVHISTATLEKKFQLEVRLSSILSETSMAVTQAGSMREPLQKLSEKGSGAVLDSIKDFQSKLTFIVGGAPGPPASDEITLARVNGQVATLYGQIWQADSEPTITQSGAASAIDHDASVAMQHWNALKNSDLPALNRALRSANLPEVQLQSDPHQEDAGMDEE
jgi:hypothetical protein